MREFNAILIFTHQQMQEKAKEVNFRFQRSLFAKANNAQLCDVHFVGQADYNRVGKGLNHE
jgi:DNA-binding protein YbaB